MSKMTADRKTVVLRIHYVFLPDRSAVVRFEDGWTGGFRTSTRASYVFQGLGNTRGQTLETGTRVRQRAGLALLFRTNLLKIKLSPQVQSLTIDL